MDKSHACPSCEGKKQLCGFVKDVGSGKTRISADVPCRMCKGLGVISDEQLSWIRLGRMHRQARVALKESALVAACRLGLSVEQLTDAELGRVSPEILRFVAHTSAACA